MKDRVYGGGGSVCDRREGSEGSVVYYWRSTHQVTIYYLFKPDWKKICQKKKRKYFIWNFVMASGLMINKQSTLVTFNVNLRFNEVYFILFLIKYSLSLMRKRNDILLN